MKLKKALLEECQMQVNNKLHNVKESIHNIQVSLISETKSSAGDKHETGRAMLQLEREKLGSQLAEVQKLNETLSKIDMKQSSEMVRLGSVVYTDSANYFLAISLGEIIINEEKFYAISPSTPIGKLLIGKTASNSIKFREIEIRINQVL